jgi:hypothetical protein
MLLNTKSKEDEKLFKAVIRFNTKFLGLALGLIWGLVIFIATNWLVIKGGSVTPDGHYVVGPHLQLLSQFFIGYKVSFLGSIVGFFYGFAIGTLCGAAFGLIYNKIVDFRN